MEPAKAETQPKHTHSLLAPQPYPCLIVWRREVYGFIVLQMDFSKKRWVRMKSIEQLTIFLCGNRGMSCVAIESGIKLNSIYYTKQMERLLYVFDLENLSISKSLPCPTGSRNSEMEWVMV
ncbi:hypothetical protein SLA2020_429150 [Shorea laevis]